LLFIAYNVLVEKMTEKSIVSYNGLSKDVWTIIIDNDVMRLDNVVAIAGAAIGHVVMIAIGVAIRIHMMNYDSKLIVRIMETYRWIAYVGAGILAWTAGEMIMQEAFIVHLLHLDQKAFMYAIIAGLTAFILLIGYLKNSKIMT